MPATAIPKGWSPETIKGCLAVELSEIARRSGKSAALVSRVIRGEKRSPAVEAAIARSLKVKREELFPSKRGRKPQRSGSK